MPQKPLELFWDPLAQLDLLSLVHYIAKDNPDSATRLYEATQKAANLISHFPDRGRIVPELKEHGNQNYREIILDPWRLIYKTEKQRAFVVAVIDGRRNMEDALFDRLTRENK